MELLILLIVVFVILRAIGQGQQKAKAEAARNEALKRRKEAEDYIMNSGDQEAIKMLMLARANPANYNQVLAGGMNSGNSTLKTALGVMAGVAAGNLIAGAITTSAISDALANVPTDFSESGHDLLASSDIVSGIDTDTGSIFDSFDI